jgi:GcrA cell cycle regulator
MSWDADDVALLKKLWASGHSAGQMAARLGHSRNAVCAKLLRMGLKRCHKPPTAKPKIVSVPKRKPALLAACTRPVQKVVSAHKRVAAQPEEFSKRQLYAILAQAVRNTRWIVRPDSLADYYGPSQPKNLIRATRECAWIYWAPDGLSRRLSSWQRREMNMATGMFRTGDGWVRVDYDSNNIPIPRFKYDENGYKPAFDELPLEADYWAAQEKAKSSDANTNNSQITVLKRAFRSCWGLS